MAKGLRGRPQSLQIVPQNKTYTHTRLNENMTQTEIENILQYDTEVTFEVNKKCGDCNR